MPLVLLVDDDPSILTICSRIIAGHCEFITAATATEASCLLDGQTFDVVITDFDMPDHDGAWLLTRVREKLPHALRVLMSGGALVDPAALLESRLVQKWLPKPFPPADLLSCVETTGANEHR